MCTRVSITSVISIYVQASRVPDENEQSRVFKRSETRICRVIWRLGDFF